MKNLLLLIIFFLFLQCTHAQQITGNWKWQSENSEHSFTLDLTQINSNIIKGRHCGLFRNGAKTDCMRDDGDYSLELTKQSDNFYQGTIFSTYSASEGVIRLTFNSSSNTIHFEIIEAPDGEFYIPRDVILEKL